MPTIDKTRLQTVKSSPLSASPTLLDGSAVSSIRPSSISANVNVRPEQTTFIPEKDIVGPVVEHVGQQLGRAAYTLAEKDAELEAQQAAIEYEGLAQKRWLGAGNPADQSN